MTTERADAARNRAVLIETAREMLTDVGIDQITMDALAERSGLGKGTVFRRFGTRSGIFMALLGDAERAFQKRVLSGPPPLGPGAEPLDRLIAFGPARLRFLMENREIARAALDGRTPVPFGPPAMMTQRHLRTLLQQLEVAAADLDILAMQLTAALDVPLLLYTAPEDAEHPGKTFEDRLAHGWEDLIHRVRSGHLGHGGQPTRPASDERTSDPVRVVACGAVEPGQGGQHDRLDLLEG